MPGPLSFIRDIIKPIADTIDAVHTSEEEKLNAKIKFKEMEFMIMDQLVSFEREKLEAQSKVIQVEAQGQSWIQRSWRPVTMLTFLVIIVYETFAPVFGFPPPNAPEGLMTLIQYGLGGYVIARSAEKVIPQWAEAKYANQNNRTNGEAQSDP